MHALSLIFVVIVAFLCFFPRVLLSSSSIFGVLQLFEERFPELSRGRGRRFLVYSLQGNKYSNDASDTCDVSILSCALLFSSFHFFLFEMYEFTDA
jgi:hypothetical protein